MSKYAYVSVPFAGSVRVRVPTEGCNSCAEVVDRAVEKAGVSVFVRIDPDDGDVEPIEIEPMRRITAGNVCFAPLHEACIESEEDDDDE